MMLDLASYELGLTTGALFGFGSFAVIRLVVLVGCWLLERYVPGAVRD